MTATVMPVWQTQEYILFSILAIWEIIWKGLGLWKAAKCQQKYWFIAILIIHSLGILEIVYLFKFAKKRMQLHELKFWENLPKK